MFYGAALAGAIHDVRRRDLSDGRRPHLPHDDLELSPQYLQDRLDSRLPERG